MYILKGLYYGRIELTERFKSIKEARYKQSVCRSLYRTGWTFIIDLEQQ